MARDEGQGREKNQAEPERRTSRGRMAHGGVRHDDFAPTRLPVVFDANSEATPTNEPSAPQLVELAESRSPTSGELALLRFLAEGPSGCQELRQQIASTQVVAACDCGCPSVGLRSAGPPVPESIVRAREPEGRDDYFLIAASGPNAAGDDVEVILHVSDGQAIELEVWSGTWPGSSPQSGLPAVADLRYRE
jgi:hypothetical protein